MPSHLLRELVVHSLIILGWILFFVELLSRENYGTGYWCVTVAALMYMLTVCYWLRTGEHGVSG